jgi:hypothetical protein
MRDPLSFSGQARQIAILALAKRAARRRRRTWQLSRAISACVTLIAVGLLLHWWTHAPGPVAPNSDHDVISRANFSKPLGIELIETDPTIADRLAVAVTPPRWQQISDDDLIRYCAEAGQSAGLIRVGDQTVLVTSSSDQEIANLSNN